VSEGDVSIDKRLIKRTINTLAQYVELPNNPDGVDMLIEMMSDTDCLIEKLEEALEESGDGE
jgi:hypothetical protein